MYNRFTHFYLLGSYVVMEVAVILRGIAPLLLLVKVIL